MYAAQTFLTVGRGFVEKINTPVIFMWIYLSWDFNKAQPFLDKPSLGPGLFLVLQLVPMILIGSGLTNEKALSAKWSANQLIGSV